MQTNVLTAIYHGRFRTAACSNLKRMKRGHLKSFANDLDLDVSAIEQLARHYRESPTATNISVFIDATEPQRQESLRRLNRVVGATADLVSMRCDLFDAISDEKELARVDVDFGHLFSSYLEIARLFRQRMQ